MRANLLLTSLLLSLLLLGACDGGSGSNNNDGVVPPPVVPPDDTLTGFLVDSAVSGVSYTTPTHQGVTGADGSFQYEQGETVRFMIGGTLLGEVTGQEQVTPFELAGAAVVTGLNIEWALDRSRYGGQVGPATPSGSIYIDEQITPEYGPFFPLVNMVVFLQSLDADADPTNGIEIRSEVAALFNGVNLNLNQEWQTFLNEPALRHAIWRANNEHRFSKAHRIVNPAPAPKNLYQSLKVNARTAAVSQEWYWDMYSADANSSVQYQYDVDGNRTRVKTLRADGTVDEVLTRRYDAEGNVIRQSIDSNGDGIRDERDEVVVRKYDQNGNPPQIELDQNADGVTDYVEYWLYDSVGNATLVKEGRREFTLGTFEGRSITREIYTGGNLTRIEFDGDDDGIIDSTDTFEYDSQGHLARFEGELPSGPRGVRVWNYDADGNLTKYVESFDSGVAATLTQNWRYDDNGHITYYDQDTTGDGSPEVVYRYLYDGERKLSQVEHWESWGSTIETDTYLLSYDGRGNLTRLDRNMESYQYFYAANEKLIRVETTSKFRPGIVQTTSYEYDSNGNLILFRVGDLSGGELSTWQYSPDGNNIRYEFRSDRNNPSPELVREYETKGWGHLFFDSAVFN